jgi:hypothetical protein
MTTREEAIAAAKAAYAAAIAAADDWDAANAARNDAYNDADCAYEVELARINLMDLGQ